MRKNGVDRELREISGGVCAPEGFKANGIFCGVGEIGKNDLALIVSEKRCPTACVYSGAARKGAPVLVTKKHLENPYTGGYARAVLVNSGVANVFAPDGERLAESVCRALERVSGIPAAETVICSTGKIGKPLSVEPFEKGVGKLYDGLSGTEEKSLEAVRAIMTTDAEEKQFAYAFMLGDYPCKIGAICKGGEHVCPNMATMLAIVTTDVRITPEMLQRALSAETRETLGLLNVDGTGSPNDTVCIMANGRAGNSTIDRADTEYRKFCLALRGVLTRIALALATDGGAKALCFGVSGARSKQSARALAKRLAGSEALKRGIRKGEIDIESVLFAALEEERAERISVRDGKGEIVVWEDGRRMSHSEETGKRIAETSVVEICLKLCDGNYGATAYGRL